MNNMFVSVTIVRKPKECISSTFCKHGKYIANINGSTMN